MFALEIVTACEYTLVPPDGKLQHGILENFLGCVSEEFDDSILQILDGSEANSSQFLLQKWKQKKIAWRKIGAVGGVGQHSDA